MISPDTYRYLVFGSGDPPAEDNTGKLCRRLIAAKETRLLRPRLIVQYEREPFLMNTGNVRVTFDRFISASTHIDRMFEKNSYALPIMSANMHLLEVKWDDFLPDIIREALKNDHLQNTSFSKYYLCRLAI